MIVNESQYLLDRHSIKYNKSVLTKCPTDADLKGQIVILLYRDERIVVSKIRYISNGTIYSTSIYGKTEGWIGDYLRQDDVSIQYQGILTTIPNYYKSWFEYCISKGRYVPHTEFITIFEPTNIIDTFPIFLKK